MWMQRCPPVQQVCEGRHLYANAQTQGIGGMQQLHILQTDVCGKIPSFLDNGLQCIKFSFGFLPCHAMQDNRYVLFYQVLLQTFIPLLALQNTTLSHQ